MFDNKAYSKKYYKDHKAEKLAYQKRYRLDHKDELSAKRKQRYQDHKAEVLAYGQAHRLKHIWRNMIDRCTNPNHVWYKHYGGRGIGIIPKWQLSYENFEKWALENGYCNGLSIDRINNDEDYCPQNCQWITRSENIAKDAGKTLRKPVNQFDLDGNFIATYPSMGEADRVTGVPNSRVCAACRGRYKTVGGYRWAYAS
jgi:hypothetical protein